MPPRNAYPSEKHDDQDVQKQSPQDDPNVVDPPDPKLLGTGLARKAGEALRERNKKQQEEIDKILKDL